MLITVTLNPAIDKRLHIAELQTGQVQRTVAEHATAGGKGLNVTRVIRTLGSEVLATGFLGGLNGEWIRKQLDQHGVNHAFIPIQGETRICLNLIDNSNGVSTEILESGPVVSAQELETMALQISEWSAPGVWFVMSGSLPKGCPTDYYARLIAAAKAGGARVLLDTSGAALIEAAKAGPYAIKPNEDEIRQLAGWDTFPATIDAVHLHALDKFGIHQTITTLGSAGCVAMIGGQFLRVTAPRIQSVNAVGSGDAFVAGLAVAWERGLGAEEALRLAVACGAANALTEHTGHVRLSDVERLVHEVDMIRE